MLSGEPFTMEEIKRAFGKNETEARSIEHGVREFHLPRVYQATAPAIAGDVDRHCVRQSQAR
jgi:hypothetical protein